MAANISPMPQYRDLETTSDADADAEVAQRQRKAALEDAGAAADDDARAMRRLAPSPSRMGLVLGGIVAVLLGGAVGYWLGSRKAARPPARVRDAASTAESLIELAPVAMALIGNPMIRALALRLLMRQISRRLPG